MNTIFKIFYLFFTQIYSNVKKENGELHTLFFVFFFFYIFHTIDPFFCMKTKNGKNLSLVYTR